VTTKYLFFNQQSETSPTETSNPLYYGEAYGVVPEMDSFSQAMARAHLAVQAGFPHMPFNIPTQIPAQEGESHYPYHTRFETPPETPAETETAITESGKYACNMCDRSFAR
jgi:hypothetical protein